MAGDRDEFLAVPFLDPGGHRLDRMSEGIGADFIVFAADCCPEFIAYSTAPGPLGPWTYRGTIMPTQGGSFTNRSSAARR